MQLLEKLRYFNTLNNKAEPYSPFHQHIKDIEDKRSRLFPDRKRVPGRKTKYILTIVLLIQIYTTAKFKRAKQTIALREQQQRQLQRKTAPFFQSLEDIQYTIIKHRTDLLMIEAFKSRGGADYLAKQKSMHNLSVWIPSIGQSVEWQKGGTTRYVQAPMDMLKGRYISGYNIQNV